jgi:diguanylate cyclase (GGDEF)-like protein
VFGDFVTPLINGGNPVSTAWLHDRQTIRADDPMETVKGWRRFLHPAVRSEKEYRAFVAAITLGSLALALAIDVANQLLFFDSWEAAIRSWIITVLLSGGIAVVASAAIGRAYFELYQAKVAVDILSRTDPLTGLPNRRAFFEAAAAAPAGTMVLVIADVDRFKIVNDTRGHLFGDEVLRTVARMFATELGSVGHVSRVGGEEFAVIATSVAVARLVTVLNAFRLRLASGPLICGSGSVRITISAGVAIRMPGATFDDLYSDADRALYDAKSSGRNRIGLALSARMALAESDVPALSGDPESRMEPGDFRPRARSA